MIGGGLVIIMTALMGAGEAASWSELAQSFALGPVAPEVDLRNMLTRHVVRRSCALLDEVAATRRQEIAAGNWQPWRDGIRRAVAEAMGPMPFGAAGGPLNVRAVLRHERPGYVVENVLFESLPGLDVNGSVYLPLAAQYPPPWPAVVIPVGHSKKTGDSYQQPAQVFARLGYVAITFDPPGMAGEKPDGNDHFRDGVRCYLTGHSSNRYFVIDALRCIDYLATRPDVDLRNGVGMSGVSGGGLTTFFATVLDERIKASGPSCCAVPRALHPVLDTYAECPEPLAFARFKQYDDIDLLTAAMPAAVLLMAGAKDEVFNESMSRRIADEVAESFAAAGFADRFAFFLDPGGHAYTTAMAVEFAKWMDRWIRNEPERPLPQISDADLEMLPDEMLACHPRQDVNIFSANCVLATGLRGHRSGLSLAEAVGKVANVSTAPPPPEARRGEPALAWFHNVLELALLPEPGVELPATYLYPAKEGWNGAALLYFDDRGRWTDLRSQGMLADISHFIDEGTNGPAVLSVDLRGWGDTRPADVRYDLAGWGERARWLSYVSAAMGDPVMAMRIRDGLAALAWLRSRPEIEPARIIVGGHGLGGVVALHVAAIEPQVAGVFCAEGLAAFELLATSPAYTWPLDAFLPNVLEHYDLPELCAGLDRPVLIARPLDAEQKPLDETAARTVYAEALKHSDTFRLECNDARGAIKAFVGVVERSGP
jgi:dienelactone hydrolase